MCTGMEALLLAGTAATTATAIDQSSQARKAAKAAAQKSQQAEAERKAAATKATQDAYASNKFAREALRSNSLFTGGGTTGAKQTLGV